jgi:hypothetical protein
MKRTALALLSCLAVSAASAAVPPAGDTVARNTTKATSQFVACFADMQVQSAQPWSFVPKENGGGTISNLGAAGVQNPYFLKVSDRGSRREIRLEAASAPTGASVLRAVDSCV